MTITFLWSSVRSQPWHNRHSFVVLDGWLRAPSSCLSLATQNWMTSLLLRMGRHPQQRQMFQFDHHHNEADDVTSRSVLLGSAGGEAKQLTTRLGVGDRTFRSASAAPIAHGRGVQRREPDGVAVSSTLHVRMDGTLVSSVLPWCDSRHASRTGCSAVPLPKNDARRTRRRRPKRVRARTRTPRGLGSPARTAGDVHE